MIKITDKRDCCGCGACASVCPKQCISMKEDNEGFFYPSTNIATCIECGLCEKVCPTSQPIQGYKNEKAFTIVSNDKDNLENSASGGSFLPLAEYIIGKGGVVFGAAYDDKMQVKHRFATTKEGIKAFSGSKYVQSIIDDSYNQVKSFLKSGKIVLFSGTPCQVQGLYKSLRNLNIDNLITLDFVCHGVPSPKVFKKFILYTTNKYESKVTDYKFRTKKYGYNSYSYSYSYSYLANGKQIWSNGKDKYAQFMSKSFFAEITSRPSCSRCAFKSKHHVSDFTVFDCWSWKKLSKNIDGKRGATTLIINTSKGEKIFDSIKKQFQYEQSNLDTAIQLDGISMLHSIPSNRRRNEFFQAIDRYSIPQLFEEFLEPHGFGKIKFFIKKLLKEVGLLQLIWNIKYQLKK